jgi:hypothetical protein
MAHASGAAEQYSGRYLFVVGTGGLVSLLLTRGHVTFEPLDLKISLGAFVPRSERIVVQKLSSRSIYVLDIAGDHSDGLRVGRCGQAHGSNNQESELLRHGSAPVRRAHVSGSHFKLHRLDCKLPAYSRYPSSQSSSLDM